MQMCKYAHISTMSAYNVHCLRTVGVWLMLVYSVIHSISTLMVLNHLIQKFLKLALVWNMPISSLLNATILLKKAVIRKLHNVLLL